MKPSDFLRIGFSVPSTIMMAPMQRCWAHLLRDIQRTLYPDDTPLAKWADAVLELYRRARACTHPQAKRRRTAQLALERRLLALCQPFLDDPSATQTHRGHQGTLVFVAEPAVPSDNNAAERSLAIWSSAARSAAAPARSWAPTAR